MEEKKENQQAPVDSKKNSSSKKLIIIILAILGVFLCICITCIVSFKFLFNKAKDNAKDLEDSIVNESMKNNTENAIENAIKEKGGEDVDVEIGDLTKDFPEDVPVYPKSKIENSFTSDGDYSATLTVEDATIDDVASFYKKELSKKGWELSEANDYFGFLVSANKGSRQVVVTIVDDEGSIGYSVVVTHDVD